jgi:Spy/CpxP family protein refolding chaperone
MSKSLYVSTCLAAAIGFSSLAFAAIPAQTGPTTPPSSAVPMQHGKWHGMHHHRGMGVLDKLDLTDTQRANIRQMMHHSFEQARPEMQALRKQREAFAATTPGSSDYQSAAGNLATAEANAARERVTREAALRSKIYDTLTVKQRADLAKLRSERKTQMQQWRTQHMHHHSGTAPASASSAG